jgi:hypothetical protein
MELKFDPEDGNGMKGRRRGRKEEQQLENKKSRPAGGERPESR